MGRLGRIEQGDLRRGERRRLVLDPLDAAHSSDDEKAGSDVDVEASFLHVASAKRRRERDGAVLAERRVDGLEDDAAQHGAGQRDVGRSVELEANGATHVADVVVGDDFSINENLSTSVEQSLQFSSKNFAFSSTGNCRRVIIILIIIIIVVLLLLI